MFKKTKELLSSWKVAESAMETKVHFTVAQNQWKEFPCRRKGASGKFKDGRKGDEACSRWVGQWQSRCTGGKMEARGCCLLSPSHQKPKWGVSVTASPRLCAPGQCYFRRNAASGLTSQGVLVIKNPPTNAGDIRDAGSIPGSGRSPGGGHGNPLQYILAWRIPRPEGPGGLWSQSVGYDWAT